MGKDAIATPEQEVSLRDTGTSLAWLADAPLFIDKEQVAAFYDAVVRPEGQQGKTVISLERYRGQTTKLEGTGEAEVSISKLITTLLPFLDVKVKGGVRAGHEQSTSTKRGETVEFYPIDTPQRQLVQLTLHYLMNLPMRLKVVIDPTRPDWYDKEFVSGLPRAIAFLDFPPETKFIPMAAEVANGRVVTIYDKLTAGEEFNPKAAMGVVEEAITDKGRIQWIDYRIPLTNPRSLHLHICGRGQFDTGTFAYNLVKRGFKHGLRVVGTLKSEPDMNVLAIFEK